MLGWGDSGAGVGNGRSGASSLAGFVWFTWTVRHIDPSSYTTWYGLGTLLTRKGPFHLGVSLLVRSGGVIITKMRLPSCCGLAGAGGGGAVIC